MSPHQHGPDAKDRPIQQRIIGLAYVLAANTTRSASISIPSARRTPLARVPTNSTWATSVSGRMVRLGRDRATARYVIAVLIRRPSIALRGDGPAPTASGRLWSSVLGCPSDTKPARNADWASLISCAGWRRIRIGPSVPCHWSWTSSSRSRRRNSSSTSANAQPGLPRSAHWSYARGAPRRAKQALVAEHPPHDPAARKVHAAVELWVREVAPIVVDGRLGRVAYIVRQCHRIGVIGPGLDQQHPSSGILGQAGGERASGGTAADDDHVVAHFLIIVDSGGTTDRTRRAPSRDVSVGRCRVEFQLASGSPAAATRSDRDTDPHRTVITVKHP